MAGFPSNEDVPSHSLSIVFITGYIIAQVKREKKVNPKFIGSPWTPEGKSKRKCIRTSQFFRRVSKGQYSPALDLMALNNDMDATVFDAWYHKYV